MPLDYDTVAAAYDRRYALQDYGGIRATLVAALERAPGHGVLELGCGTGRWLGELVHAGCDVAGIDPSVEMLKVAGASVRADLRRGVAESLPFDDASFDAVFVVNALHHFQDPGRAVGEAHRVLRAGGVFLSIGMDPHAGHDRWWVYEFFAGTLEADRARFAPEARRRDWLAAAGFVDVEIAVAETLRGSRSLEEALADGVLERSFTSQLTLLTDDDYAGGLRQLHEASRLDAGFRLVSDITLYSTSATRLMR